MWQSARIAQSGQNKITGQKFPPTCVQEEGTMKISARNQFKGKIVKIEEGAVNAVVAVDIGGRQVVSTITMESAKSLGLAVGKEVYAIIKASSVMIGVD
jgi:molybdopterin-binding protein